MRTIGWAAALLFALASPVLAQSVYDGPLAAPDAAPTAPTTSPHHKAKPKKIHHAAARAPADEPFGAQAPAPGAAAGEAAPPVRKSVADDPLSLGMKWNGNNDTAGQTRSQNLDGNAYGSGAEVGMKLHF